MKTLLSLGHGYPARALARRLIPQGWRVIGTTRSPAKAETVRAEGVERAPVVLPESAWNAWLHAGWKDAAALIAAYPSSLTTISGSAPPRPR